MDFHIGAEIVDQHGERLGHLHNVIIDPVTKQIAELVLGESGFLGSDVIVPIEKVSEAEEDQIRLKISKDEASELKPFVVSGYASADMGDDVGPSWAESAFWPRACHHEAGHFGRRHVPHGDACYGTGTGGRCCHRAGH